LEPGPSYLEDASGFRGHADRLFIPESAREVADILADAASGGIAVTVRGAGTGLTGGAVARGGWVLSTERLKRLEIESGLAIAGAGVTLDELQRAAARTGQFYPPDPTETSASVGGTVATNASGARSFRYGPTGRWIARLEVVLAGGRILDVRRGDAIDFPLLGLPLPEVTKNTAGPLLAPGMDWIDLFAGSEGTLGVVTEADLQLLPRPESLVAGVVFLRDDTAVCAALAAWRAISGLRMLEYFDRASLDLLRARFSEVPAGAGGALLFEQEAAGDAEAETGAWCDRLDEAGADLDESWFATGERDRERFRVFRHALPELVNERVRRMGFLKLGSDYAVPAANTAAMLAIYRERLEAAFPGRYVIFGHIGDAHLHVNILPESESDFTRGGELMLELAREAVRLGGTVSAEHGLGKRKAGLLGLQYSEEQIEQMRSVKRRLDPRWILSPGNLFAK